MVRSGRYQNASEVLREGLRLVEQRTAEDAARLEALKKAVAAGWDDIAAGRYADITEEGLGDFIGALGEQAAASRRISPILALPSV
ncbi:MULTISPECIES: type II toxin-antitoxin system ParD family antitoxin [Sphingobium]|uniref:type II toxin-antitoxin system ParD family antitoxin n=1 Tax=Sphingobium TaxID=165695 RepID=UPI00214B39CF|nr:MULTISPECIES: type II toxin-antitoxin system ParD family antitoxin [Sphingobium]WDA39049.1 type II toxin-antitoxin system ParD family antitoxin [Sphingobium sp. YC-XJ3]